MTRSLKDFKNGTVTGVSQTALRSGGSIVWNCICDCGHEFTLPARELVHAKSLSHPGCVLAKTRHPLYSTWRGILNRTRDSNNKDYGGRGIAVCQSWLDSFEQFCIDMGTKPSPLHSIERIDVNGDYCKENCTWASPQEQAVNKRFTLTSSNYVDIYNKRKSHTAAELATEYGIAIHTVKNIWCFQYSRQVTAWCKQLGNSDFEALKLYFSRKSPVEENTESTYHSHN